MTKKNIFFTFLVISISTFITLLIIELFFRVDFYLKTVNFFKQLSKKIVILMSIINHHSFGMR